MKEVLKTQGWNLVLVCAVLGLGWLFPNEIGSFLSNFFPVNGGWIVPTEAAALLFGIPVTVIFLLSSLGSKGWYFWTFAIVVFFTWILSPEDAEDFLSLLFWLGPPLVVGVIVRTLIKFFPFSKIFAR